MIVLGVRLAKLQIRMPNRNQGQLANGNGFEQCLAHVAVAIGVCGIGFSSEKLPDQCDAKITAL